jgi:hypothetical protein
MLVHSVYFWLKPELSEAQRVAFRAGLESLRAIEAVDTLHLGTPAAIPDRPVVDRSYSYNACVLFKDVAAHDAYQVDPIHKTFVETFRSHWAKVQIYDAAS